MQQSLVEVQLVLEDAEELGVAKAGIGDEQHLHFCRQQLGKSGDDSIFIVIAPLFHLRLTYRQPQ